MNVVRDDWTPFLKELRSRVSANGRKRLLFQLIGDVYDVTILNFNQDSVGRPAPWKSLNESYAQEWHDGDTTPTLQLSELNHFLRNGTSKRMIDNFQVYYSGNKAQLTNGAPYADVHQFGLGNIPARPYYPVEQDGETFTWYMEERLKGIVESHFSMK